MLPADVDILAESDNQRTVRMVFIVMFDRHCKIMQCRSYIRFRHERDVVFLGVRLENGIYGHSRFATPILTTSWLA